MLHHEDMDKSTAPSKIEVLGCVAAALALGAYLASSAHNLALQAILMSFPSAALLVALRRTRHTSTAIVQTFTPTMTQETFEEVTAGLEFDILTRAS